MRTTIQFFASPEISCSDNQLQYLTACSQVILTADEKQFIEQRSAHAAIGSPEQVRDKLFELADLFSADELMTVTITHDFNARLRSYQLLADAFRLQVGAA